MVVSTDWDAIAWHASDSARMSRVLSAFAEHCAHTALPRTLAPKLRQAGFLLREQRVIPQFNPSYNPDTYSYQIARLIGAFVTGRQGVTEEDVRAWLEDLRQTGEAQRVFLQSQSIYVRGCKTLICRLGRWRQAGRRKQHVGDALNAAVAVAERNHQT